MYIALTGTAFCLDMEGPTGLPAEKGDCADPTPQKDGGCPRYCPNLQLTAVCWLSVVDLQDLWHPPDVRHLGGERAADHFAEIPSLAALKGVIHRKVHEAGASKNG